MANLDSDFFDLILSPDIKLVGLCDLFLNFGKIDNEFFSFHLRLPEKKKAPKWCPYTRKRQVRHRF